MQCFVKMAGVVVVGGLGLGCSVLPSLPGTGGSGGPSSTVTTGQGQVTTGGAARDYTVDAANSNLLLLSKKRDASNCSFFHHHAVGALSARYTFSLNKDDPASSWLTAEVFAAGLDADADGYRAAFPETAGTTVPESERGDIRTNMLQQIDGEQFSTITFAARQLSTLDGSGTSDVETTLKGRVSHFTMNATASWNGDTVTIDGTGALDGAQHDMPVGSFRDCIDPVMPLKLHLVLVPGRATGTDVDASIPPFNTTDFPDTVPCGSVGWEDVRDVVALHCGACHGENPQYGATVPLHNHQAFHVNSRLYPDGPLWEDSQDRLLATDTQQMPPAAYPITQAELTLLQDWLGGGAPLHKCDGAGQPLEVPAIPAPGCGTARTWIYEDEAPRGSGLRAEWMNPGEDCIACHVEEREFAAMVMGGTVFRNVREADDCFAWPAGGSFSDIRVFVTDANQRQIQMAVDESGNFLYETGFTRPAPVPPYTAFVRNMRTGDERHMVGPQEEMSCNLCHTELGTMPPGNTFNAPPGRIVAPGLY